MGGPGQRDLHLEYVHAPVLLHCGNGRVGGWMNGERRGRDRPASLLDRERERRSEKGSRREDYEAGWLCVDAMHA